MPKTKTSKKSSVAKKAAPAPKAPAVEAKAPEVPVEDTTPNLQEQFAGLLAQLTALRSQLTTVTTQVRVLSKRTDRELKAAKKQGKRKKVERYSKYLQPKAANGCQAQQASPSQPARAMPSFARTGR